MRDSIVITLGFLLFSQFAFLTYSSINESYMADKKYFLEESSKTDYYSFVRNWNVVSGIANGKIKDPSLEIKMYRYINSIEFGKNILVDLNPSSSKIIILSNSIDKELTGKELISYLKEKGFETKIIDAEEFESHKALSNIVILGGHKAYEGVGEIVNEILANEEKAILEQDGGSGIFFKNNLFSDHQKIIILAGNDREDTRKIAFEKIDDIIYILGNILPLRILAITQVKASILDIQFKEVNIVALVRIESIYEYTPVELSERLLHEGDEIFLNFSGIGGYRNWNSMNLKSGDIILAKIRCLYRGVSGEKCYWECFDGEFEIIGGGVK